jgi:alkanesulfonate monooxygenase
MHGTPATEDVLMRSEKEINIMEQPVEFVGFTFHYEMSEIIPERHNAFDLDFMKQSGQVQEAGGFSRVLTPFASTFPENLLICQYVASQTERLKLLVAHRPGFMAPTWAARQLATLDHLSRGRVSYHMITGASDADMRKDCDWTDKDLRYARASEYLDVMKLEWTSEKPFDYEGKFYRVAQGFSDIMPVQKPHPPVFFGGSSAAAIAVAGKHADTYALWGGTHEQVKENISQVRMAAAPYGRDKDIRFSVSFRPILADTEEKAWARAHRIREEAIAYRKKMGLPLSDHSPPSAGGQRQLAAATQSLRFGQCLWMGVAIVTGAASSSTALVGTPDQVADALLEFYDLGVRTFLIRGYEPLKDAREFGATLIPSFKSKLAARSR